MTSSMIQHIVFTKKNEIFALIHLSNMLNFAIRVFLQISDSGLYVITSFKCINDMVIQQLIVLLLCVGKRKQNVQLKEHI